MNTSFELSNIDGLDDSICNAIGMDSNMINENLLNGLTENTSLLNANGYSNLINENLLDGLTENTSLLNANGYSNMINENLLNGLTENTSLLNATGDYVNADTIKAGTEITTSVLALAKAKADESGCKKPSLPESFLNRGKWSRYRDCVKQAQAKIDAATKAEAERTEQERIKLERAKIEASKGGGSGDDKILGMPKGVAIGLGVVLLGAVAFVGYKMIKK